MNIHEYQAKQLLAQYGVAVPLEIPAKSLDEVRAAAEKITAGGSARVVVKSQIHAGGRGKGTFKTGFQGGVKVAASVDEAVSLRRKTCSATCSSPNRPARTAAACRRCSSPAARKSKRNFIWPCCSTAPMGRPLVMASTEGGMDIEEVAAKTPEKIFKEWIDPAVGIMPFQARKIAAALGLKGDLFNAAAKFVTGVFNTWWECDAVARGNQSDVRGRTAGRQGNRRGAGRQNFAR